MSNTHQPKAFPKNADFGVSIPSLQDGMDLRDYFAAHALPLVMERASPTAVMAAESVADGCYLIADAMMERRRK